MRTRRMLLAVLMLAGRAYAENAPVVHPKTEAERQALAASAVVLSDTHNNFYVLPRKAAGITDAVVYVGDGKQMFRQRIVGGGLNGDAWDLVLVSKRVRNLSGGTINKTADGKYTLACRADRDDALTLVAEPKAAELLRSAEFREPLEAHHAHLLARDENGIYYYVDKLAGDGLQGVRVFVGKKGAMKPQAMTNIVADSAGEIYATKNGKLRIVAGSEDKATWFKGKRPVSLLRLPLWENRYLIYRELGIYGRMGYVCDDE